MRQITVQWGKLRIEIPGEMFWLLVLKAFLLYHNVNG